MHNYAYNCAVTFEWDCGKADSSRKKHRVDFAEAATVFDDAMAITIPDAVLEEERYVTVGIDALARVLVVVYTWRGNHIRIISARKATPSEIHEYKSCL
jgi:uncharacterized protein